MADMPFSTSRASAGSGAAARPFAVFDRTGELLGTFATWETAHQWGHMAAAQTGALHPIEVEDRATRTTQRIDVGSCLRIGWVIAEVRPDCPRTPARTT